jgi:hypothetical protein
MTNASQLAVHPYRGMFDFMILQVIGLALVFFFRDVALWVPRVLFK